MVTYKVGDTIEYTTYGGDVRRVTVTAKHRNVKNGRAGFDAAMNNSDGGGVSVWGYDADVLRVILPTGEAHTPVPLTFKVSADDSRKIVAIMLRAASVMNFERHGATRLDVSMDLTACHANACTLDLAGLLTASNSDLIHDVAGIITHIDRETGKLMDCFLPRYAKPEQVQDEARASYQGEPGLEESQGDSIGQ
jgi:hypothetical protein